VRKEQALLDLDIAEMYGVETRNINKTTKNNPDRFTYGYTMDLFDESCTF
jgi:hypothetical protein